MKPDAAQDSKLHPYRGLRVLEFTHAVLGPTCGQVLADLGAEVVRVEPPGGDPTRGLKGFGQGYYPFFNRNKKSVVLDLKSGPGLEIARKLIARADVLVENFGPGTMDRLGLGYDKADVLNPRLIYVMLKGFMPGPYEHRAALDEVVQTMTGLTYMTGPPGQPLRAGASVIDVMTGVYGAMSVMAALHEREASGKGQLVRGALFETAAYLMGHHMTYAAVTETPVPPMPARQSAWAIYHLFDSRDGKQIFIGVTSDSQWLRFCKAFEKPSWAADARLTTNNARSAAADWLHPEIRALMESLSESEILARCESAGLPFAPVVRPEDLFTDPQLAPALLDVQLPDGRTARLPRQPMDMGGRTTGLESHPPPLGNDSFEVLGGLGYTQEEIRSLVEAGVTAGESPE